MVTFDERPGTRRSNSAPPTFELQYVCEGAFDSGTVKTLAMSLTAPVVVAEEGFLLRQNIQVDEQSHSLYYVTVSYGQRNEEVGSYRFSGSSNGGTLHISHSRETVETYPSSGVRSHNQAIDIDKDNQPRGTDIVVPTLKLSYDFKHPAGTINEDFARNAARITGCVNEDTWHGFEPGEALILGADFSDGTDSEAECQWHIAAEENLQDLVIAGITGIEKQGHDFLWVWWEDNVEDNQRGVTARAVYIERLYRRINFLGSLGF